MKLKTLILFLVSNLLILSSCSSTKITPHNNELEKEYNSFTHNTRSVDDFDSTIIVNSNKVDNYIAQSDSPMDIEVPLVKPALNLESIKKLWQTYTVEFDACFKEELLKSNDKNSLSGQIMLNFKINTLFCPL